MSKPKFTIEYDETPELLVQSVQPSFQKEHSVNPMFPEHPTLLYITSPTGAGKTNLVQYMLIEPYNQFFDKIFIFCPTLHQPSWKKLKLDPTRCFKQYTDATFLQVLEEIKKDPDEKALIIIDDCTATNLFKKNNAISQFSFNHRHYPESVSVDKPSPGTSMWIISHQYKTLPMQVRGIIKDLIMFRIHSDEEFKLIAEDCKGQALSFKEFKYLYHLCTDEKYNFMYIKKECPDVSKRIRRNFNTILTISQEDDNASQSSSSSQ
jgi:hypothetical protein